MATNGDDDGGRGDRGRNEFTSGEWLDLGRAMRADDVAVHDEMLDAMRGVVTALRARRETGRLRSAVLFCAPKVKASA